MKTRLDIIAVCFSLVLLVGCGSRKVEREKSEVVGSQQLAIGTNKAQEKEVWRVVRDTIVVEKEVEVRRENKEERQKEQTIKKREYYESGVLKSEQEEWKSETEQISELKQELEKEKTQSETLKKEKEDLLQRENTYQLKIQKLEEKSNNKKTERKDDFWLYVLLVGLGFLGGFAFDRLVLK